MKTIFNTIILALLAIFVTACGDASNVNVGPDGSVGECLDEAPVGTCGLNGNGLAVFECVDGVWEETGCDDSDICMNGAVDSDVCGLNGNGEQTSICIEGSWVENDCVDTDECVNNDTMDLACGNSGLGTTNVICESGKWVGNGECTFDSHEKYYAEFGNLFYHDGYASSGSPDDIYQKDLSPADYTSGDGRSGQISISFWIDRTDGETEASYMSFGWHQTENNQPIFRRVVNATCSGSYGESGTCTTSGNTHMFNADDLGGSFHHMVFVVDFIVLDSTHSMLGMNVKIYIDGEIVDNIEYVSNDSYFIPKTLLLGESTIADYKHVAVFDHALSADEVDALYSYGH